MSVNNDMHSSSTLVLIACLSAMVLALGIFFFKMAETAESEASDRQEIVQIVDKHYPALVKSLGDDKLSDDVIDAMLEIDSKTGKEYFTPIVLEVSGEDFSEKYKKQVKIKLQEVKKDWGTKE